MIDYKLIKEASWNLIQDSLFNLLENKTAPMTLNSSGQQSTKYTPSALTTF